MSIRSTDSKFSNAGSSTMIRTMVDKIQSVEGLAGDFFCVRKSLLFCLDLVSSVSPIET